MVVNSQRCTSEGLALSFVWAWAPGGGLLAAAWTDAEAGGDPAPAQDHGRLHAGRRGFFGTGTPVPVPFEPRDFFLDPGCWRAPDDVPPGSVHARRVWAALCAIPVGETRSYGQIADAIGSAPRAVGQACRANPWPLFIPCHRVVPAGGGGNGATGGYAGNRRGPLADVKAWLLAHEARASSSGSTMSPPGQATSPCPGRPEVSRRVQE
ncbi:methylated-DNA--[protein]-cysteine S-methyltransferase [Thioalkalivibrio sp.]|uniref:methylated-DNA--[protein]-cysteine S-methyltransferase n=1 Tax=Thioalkalivibrio sp. TaxID=2093813 RepID=UPI003566C4D5